MSIFYSYMTISPYSPIKHGVKRSKHFLMPTLLGIFSIFPSNTPTTTIQKHTIINNRLIFSLNHPNLRHRHCDNLESSNIYPRQ